ncbi:nuclear pore complex assembly-domain-containing protein [Mycena leptocephala]|nr:nuclear pore complex assembly-domain-containing protein [Mycena leptocephala]
MDTNVPAAGCIGDLLLFDILLTSGGIREPDTLYPPVDIDSFHRLLEAIQTSTYDALKRDCLVYFLLKWYQDGREEKYKLEKCIPPQFASLSDAYWHLDAGTNIPRAVSILSDARLNTDYASKILQAISLSPKPMPLVLKYVRTAKPLLTEPDDIDLYTVALAESSLLEAWQFQRTFSEGNETRPDCSKKYWTGAYSSVPRRNALVQLLGIALTPYEQSLMQSYATPPSTLPPRRVATLQNLICVRLIQTGRYAEAIKMDPNLGPQAERTKMNLESGSSSREMNMSMSWEDLRPPLPPALPRLFLPYPECRYHMPSSLFHGAKETPRSNRTSVFPLSLSTLHHPLHAQSLPLSRTHVPKGNLAAQPKVPPGRQPLNARFAASPGSSPTPKQNAFYNRLLLYPRTFPAFNEVSAAEGSRALPRDNADVEMDQGDISSLRWVGKTRPGEDESLAYSVFGSKPIRSSKRAGTQTRQAPVEAKKVPPGAFRRPLEHGSAQKQEQEQELSRALPGSLMESEDGSADEADEEDGDRLAPLPPRQGRPLKGSSSDH